MKILKKRAFALLIDSFIFGSIIAIIQLVVPDLLKGRGLLLILLFIPLFFRDIVFRNASIGKKLLGISIYNDNWEKPDMLHLARRSFFSLTFLYVMTFKCKFTDGEYISIFDLEREKLKTRVIDNNVYNELKAKAEGANGDYAKNMTELYNEYLRGLYLN